MSEAMTGDAITVSDATAKVPAKRGRKSETAQQRFERLERELRTARQAIRDTERRKFQAVGEDVLAELAEDEALKSRVVEILRRRITTASGRADIATLLV